MLLQKVSQTLSVTVLTNHVTGSVSIAVFRVIISALDQQCLEYLCVSSDASHVKRRPQILGLAVNECTELSENLDHLDVSLIARNMEWCPAIRVALVQECLC